MSGIRVIVITGDNKVALLPAVVAAAACSVWNYTLKYTGYGIKNNPLRKVKFLENDKATYCSSAQKLV